jgi:primosomal protein N' (replication factor Y)
MALLRGRHRVRLIVKADRQAPMQGLLRAMVSRAGPARGGARLDIDVDPINFF